MFNVLRLFVSYAYSAQSELIVQLVLWMVFRLIVLHKQLVPG